MTKSVLDKWKKLLLDDSSAKHAVLIESKPSLSKKQKKKYIESEAQFYFRCFKEFGVEVRIAPEPVLKRYKELVDEYLSQRSTIREDFKLDEL